MVEIKPYISDDDEEESWVPLSSPFPSSDPAPPAARGEATSSSGKSIRRESNSFPRPEDAPSSDDGEDWEALPRHHAAAGHTEETDGLQSAVRAAVAGEAAGLVGRHLLSLLTSTPSSTTRDGTTDTTRGMALSSSAGRTEKAKGTVRLEDGAESSDDEGVNWSRPNGLGEDKAMEFDRRRHRRGARSAVEEEYDDIRPAFSWRTSRGRGATASGSAPAAEMSGRLASEEARCGRAAGLVEPGGGRTGLGGGDEASNTPRLPGGKSGKKGRVENEIEDQEEVDVGSDRAKPEEPSKGAKPDSVQGETKVEDNETPPPAHEFDTGDDEQEEVPESQFVRIDGGRPPTSEPERQSQRRRDQRRQAQRRQGQADAQSPGGTIKSHLRQKLVYAPLMSLPGTFLHHLCVEVVDEFRNIWERLRGEDFRKVAAPLALALLLLLVAAALVSKGVWSLVVLGVTNAVCMMMSVAVWCVKFYTTVARYTLWTTLFACALGYMVQRLAAREELSIVDWTKTKMPPAKALLPWVMTVTSLSFYEILTLWLSTGIILRTLLLPWVGTEGCAEDQVCTEQGTSALGAVAVLLSATVIAFLNLITVRHWVAAKGTKELDDGGADSGKPPTSSFYVLVARIMPKRLLSEFATAYSDVTRNIASCHASSVVYIAAAAVALTLSRVLYDGRGDLAVILGTIGASAAFIALGGFLVVQSWKIASSAVSDGDLPSFTFEELSRRALSSSVAEVTSSVWTEEGGLLGALSGDEDEALKLAVLKWVIDNLKSRGRTDAGDVPSEDVQQVSTDMEDDENTIREHSTPSLSSSRSPERNPDGAPEPAAFTRLDSSRLSYQSLQDLIAKLDADDTLIPSIQRYRTWVYSLPPSNNIAMYLAMWKMCPASFLTGAMATRLLIGAFLSVLQLLQSGVHFACAPDFWIRLVVTMATVVILLPTVVIEYERVRIWWAKSSTKLVRVKADHEFPSQADAYKSVIILRADWEMEQPGLILSFVFDSTASFQRIWAILIDSIAALERSVPAVRCATVASATANLTSDSITLVDLAVEVNRRGLLGGIGLLVWDAFQFHLSRELESRSDGTDRGLADDCGGKYTSAVVGAVQNVGKIGHNINQMRISRQSSPGEHEDTSEPCDPGDGRSTSAPEDEASRRSEESEVKVASNNVDPECTDTDQTCEDVRPEDASLVNSARDDNETQDTKAEGSNEEEKEGNHLLPLVGGGLALLGTAVATIAISASKTGKKDRDGRRKKEERNTSLFV